MTSISLPARLDTVAAISIAVDLQQLVEAGNPLDLTAADVDLVGLAGLQVLASAHKTALKNNQSFSLTRPSDALRDACELSGLGFLLAPHQGLPS